MHLPCIRLGCTSSYCSPARGFSAPAHSDLSPPSDKPSDRSTVRILTGRVAETAYLSARSTPLPPTPIYPSPAPGTPSATSPRTPSWSESQNTAPSRRTFSECAVSDAPRFPAVSASLWPAHSYCGHGSGSSVWCTGIVCQPGAHYRRLFQITAQVLQGVFTTCDIF